MTGKGEERLRAALGRFAKRRGGRPPVTLAPTTAFEAVILERINALQADVATLQDQNKWLLRLIAGMIFAALLDLLLK